MGKKTNRRHLRPWLEKNINMGSIPGLQWHDKGKKIFRIPWSDKRKPTWNVTDAQVFKAYALVSGKSPGDKDYFNGWKTLLRAALYKCPEVEEMKALHKVMDKKNPYKVYRFLDNDNLSNARKKKREVSPNCISENCLSIRSSRSNHTSCISLLDLLELEGSYYSETVHSSARGSNISNNSLQFDAKNPANIPTVVFDVSASLSQEALKIDQFEYNVNIPETMSSYPHAPDKPSQTQQCLLGYNNEILPEANSQLRPHALEHETALTPNAPNISSQTNIGGLHSENQTEISPVMKSKESAKLTDPGYNNNSPNGLSIGAPFHSINLLNSPVMKIKVFFAEQCVLSESFDEQGARLFCGDLTRQTQVGEHFPNGTYYGPMNFKQISIPYIDEMKDLPLNEIEKRYIRKIQNFMKRGLLLWSCDTHIYAKRICKARVVYKCHNGLYERIDRDNEHPVCVFDFDYFKQKLQKYSEDVCALPQPSPSVIFYLGQNIECDSMNQNFLLYVKVTHVDAENLLLQTIENKLSYTEVFASKSNPDDILADMFEHQLSIRPSTQNDFQTDFSGLY